MITKVKNAKAKNPKIMSKKVILYKNKVVTCEKGKKYME